MQNIFLAYVRAFRTLLRPDVFWHLLWPSLLAIVLWLVVAIFFWTDAVVALMHVVQSWPLVGDWFVHGTASLALAVVLNILLFLLLVPIVFVTSAIFVSTLALPLMLDRISATDYRDLDRRGGGSIAGSIVNALWALLLFVIFVLLTLPLWLIPGLGFVLSVLLSAWLNQRCYGYDALMNHADKAEMKRIIATNRSGMYCLGMGAGVMAFVPILNLAVPAFTGLAFVHYLLEALRRERLASSYVIE